ncbi:MAG: hypothetical protein NTY41_07095 [Proteobacteria bacterium]|nr:hypothetical protein [Pseudomonadota bacterium]
MMLTKLMNTEVINQELNTCLIAIIRMEQGSQVSIDSQGDWRYDVSVERSCE